MSARQQIEKLEALLARVQERAHARGGAEANGASAYVSEPPAYDDSDYADVEVSAEVVEVDIDVEEPMAMESGAQPVAAHATMPPDELEEVVEEEVHAAAANEIEEPAPSSSRRPIAGEAPEAESYEEESAPRHTPPPESGKQVAAPSVQPAARKSSVPPPPSLEGRTLIGGWREPGLPPEVRSPGAPPAQRPAMGGMGGMGAPPPPRPAAGARVSAETTAPDLPAQAAVASFESAPPTFKPSRFGDLLDASLGL